MLGIRYTRLCMLIGSASYLWSFSTALPAFNKANEADINGQQCPARPFRNQACPVLCVPDAVRDCPATLAPVCPTDQQFCGDGVCRTRCHSVVNVCACGQPVTAATLQPCLAGQLTNVPAMEPRANATTKAALIAQQCALDLTLDPMRIGSTEAPLAADLRTAWLSCPNLPPPAFTYTEPMFQSQYIYFSVQFLLVGLWHLYKRYRERSFRVHSGSEAAGSRAKPSPRITTNGAHSKDADTRSALNEKRSHPLTDGSGGDDASTTTADTMDGRTTFKGYRNALAGLFVFLTVQLTTLWWLILLGIIVADYYGLVTGIQFGVFLSNDLASKIFVTIWHFTTVWLVAVNLTHERIRNYFRLQTDLASASVVQVETRRDPVILLEDGSRWLKRLHRIESRISRWCHLDTLVSSLPISISASGQRYFEYQCTRYVLDASARGFRQHQPDMGRTHRDYRGHAAGLDSAAAAQLRDMLGQNFIAVHVSSFPVALLEEFQAFFYLYQLMCLWVWFYFSYYYMGLVQLVVILVSALVKVYLRLKSEHKVKSLAEYRSECRVLRDGHWQLMSTIELVPGDVLEVTEGLEVPCDAVILSGEVVADESSLTGESMPIRKFPLADEAVEYQPLGTSKGNTLFAGTTILTATATGADEVSEKGTVTALVTATGTSTDKGKLVRKILFPSQISFIFNEHLKGVVCILLLWGIVCFGLSIWLMGRGDITSWFYGLFVISQIMSPLLPAALVVGQSVAAARLRKKSIFCVDLPRVMIAGKVRVFCFDKTGTLTKEGLDYYGMCVTDAGTKQLVPVPAAETTTHAASFITRIDGMDALSSVAQMGVAACHSVTMISGRIIGNPVDAEQFRASGWAIRAGDQPACLDTLQPMHQPHATPVHVVKRFEFVHARASMSVAVLDQATGHVHIYMKGSFERVKSACVPASLPDDYDERAARYAAEGCYVLAIGHRDLGPIPLEELRHMSREDLEQSCTFIGLLLFKNQLKPDTADAIAELKRGDTRTVMITGDNALTGVFIARQCGMVPNGTRVLLGDVKKSAGNSNVVEWRDVDNKRLIDDIELELAADKVDPCELAMTGPAFDALIRTGRMRHLLLNTRIFARMTPDGKVACVQLFMERAVTAMCGDGGNDCGALRVAHCGIALSEAEASIVSPFSTSVRSIFSCVELLRQGRAALATSFAGYKFLIMYGETMCFLELIQYYFTVVVPQWVWVLIDGFVTVGLSYALTQAKPARRLAPMRPTARLLGPETLVSTIAQVLVNLLFFCFGVLLLFRQPWFRCNEFDASSVDASKWWLLGDNYEAALITAITLPQFINAAATFNYGHRYRSSWWRNYVLVGCYAVMMAFVSYVILADPNPVGCWFRTNCGDPEVLVSLGYPQPTWHIERYNSPLGHNVLPPAFRWTIWGYAMANCAVTLAFEYFVILGPVRAWAKRRFPRARLSLAR